MSLAELALLFLRFGAFSFGGGTGILADLERELVDVRGLLTHAQFATAYAVGQATPGPGVLYMIPVGYLIDGPWGGAVAMAAFFAVPAILILVAATVWHRVRLSPWARSASRASRPVIVGLSAGSLYALSRPLIADPVTAGGIVVAAALVLSGRVPGWLLVVGFGIAAAALRLARGG